MHFCDVTFICRISLVCTRLVNISYSSFYAYFIFSLIFSRFSKGEKMYTSAKKTGAGESAEVAL